MIFYLAVLTCVILGIWLAYKESDGFWENLGTFMVVQFSGAVCLIILTLLMNILVDSTSPKVKQHVVRPIVSLHNDKDITFVLGCGGSYEQYYFMYDLGDGQYQRGFESTRSTVVREFNGEVPNHSYDIVWNYTPKWGFWWPTWLTLQFKQTTNDVLTVPKGTVIQRFEVK